MRVVCRVSVQVRGASSGPFEVQSDSSECSIVMANQPSQVIFFFFFHFVVICKEWVFVLKNNFGIVHSSNLSIHFSCLFCSGPIPKFLS